MIRKFILIVFSFLFILAIALPPLNMNLKHNQKSDIDNRMLHELPTLEDMKKGFRGKLENALNDRIGFRRDMLSHYQEINDKLFGVIVNPLYMYGQDGYIYYRPGYIAAYQNIYNRRHIEEIAQYIKHMDDYLASRGIDFFYFVVPDKKTIYPEHFPKGINKSSNPPQMEVLLESVGKLGIDCVTPLETFLALKNDIQLYNVQYDPGHWNQDGAIIGISLLLDRISKKHPDVAPLQRENYVRGTRKPRRQYAAPAYKISEYVPDYALKEQCRHAEIDGEIVRELVSTKESHTAFAYNNAAKAYGLTALIFGDSYFNQEYHKFFVESFARTVRLHFYNLPDLVYYLNIFSPDIVILENCERSLETLYGVFNEAKIDSTFFPHASSSELALDASTKVSVEEVEISKGAKITTISGKVTTDGDAPVTSLYAELNGREYPTQADKDGKFSLSLANSDIAEVSEIMLTPADEESAVRYKAIKISL